MTRINVIPANMLLDQHLLAEVNEIPRLAKLTLKYWTRNYKSTNPEILPNKYTMGEGHVKFFYDKGFYIRLRSLELDKEADKRRLAFQPAYSRLFEDYLTLTGRNSEIKSVDKDWVPSVKDIEINIMRIIERIDTKPFWYKMNKVALTPDTYKTYKQNLLNLIR